MPTGGTITSPLLVAGRPRRREDAVDAGRRTPGRRRRGPRRRQRRLGRAGAARRRRRTRCGPSSRAALLGGYAFTRYTSGADARRRPGEVVVLTDAARTQGRQRGRRDARGSSRRPSTLARDWVNTPPATSPPSCSPTPSSRQHKAPQGPPRSKVDPVTRRRSSWPSAASAASSASAQGSANPPRLVELTYAPRGAEDAPRPGRQGHHVRLRRPDASSPAPAWTTMKCDMAGAAAVVAATFAIAELGLPVRVTTVAADGREHGLRRRDAARRRADDVRRHRPSRCSTPTPRAGWSSPTRWCWRARRARRDRSTSPP